MKMNEAVGYLFKVFGTGFFTSDNHFEIVSYNEDARILLKSRYDYHRSIEICASLEDYRNRGGCENLFSITISGWYYNRDKGKLDMVNSATTSFYLPVKDESLIEMAHTKMMDCYQDILEAFAK